MQTGSLFGRLHVRSFFTKKNHQFSIFKLKLSVQNQKFYLTTFLNGVLLFLENICFIFPFTDSKSVELQQELLIFCSIAVYFEVRALQTNQIPTNFIKNYEVPKGLAHISRSSEQLSLLHKGGLSLTIHTSLPKNRSRKRF